MRYKFIVPLILLFAAACSSNTPAEEDALKGKLPATLVSNPRTLNDTSSSKLGTLGKLVFTDTLHNFGVLKDGEVAEYEFAFTNTGNSDIIINEAKASCGCTVASYPEQPFRPNAHDKIKVTFDSKGKAGMNEKEVIVKTNGNPSVYKLVIQAQVLDK